MPSHLPRPVLPVLLSAIAGTVDVIGLQRMGLFTAHITGNIVILAAQLVTGGPPRRLQILSLPVFMLAVAATGLIARPLRRRGIGLVRPLLVVQCVLIGVVLLLSAIDREGPAAMLAVSAMACQFAMLRLALPGVPSTAVMTGNLTQVVLARLDTASSTDARADAEVNFRKTGRSLLGFFLGCTAGAVAVMWVGKWAWSLPVVMAAVAALL
jgi:uncharacterized membrane protein YoaK (UPF0700 family)